MPRWHHMVPDSLIHIYIDGHFDLYFCHYFTLLVIINDLNDYLTSDSSTNLQQLRPAQGTRSLQAVSGMLERWTRLIICTDPLDGGLALVLDQCNVLVELLQDFQLGLHAVEPDVLSVIVLQSDIKTSIKVEGSSTNQTLLLSNMSSVIYQIRVETQPNLAHGGFHVPQPMQCSRSSEPERSPNSLKQGTTKLLGPTIFRYLIE
jgi:hypothetical protein